MNYTAGAAIKPDGAHFCVWSPQSRSMEVFLPETDAYVAMEPRPFGYWTCIIPDLTPGTKYLYRINGSETHPDPASRYQPEGVHGPSALVEPDFPWTDQNWCGVPLEKYVLYELHVGVYTPEGTFEALIPHLENLKELGVTAIELMPICQFPGKRNWGYDGVYPFAPQESYGGPVGLKKLVDAAHRIGIAIVLDVVYNHLGPEGNYVGRFGPYFSDCYKTPWGDALNFDGPYSGGVREFFLQNVEYWIREYHVDGLRLDAAHEIHDKSPTHILAEFQQVVSRLDRELNRRVHMMIECDANDVRYLNPPQMGGYGIEAQWLDDFHHALYTHVPEVESWRYDQDYGAIDSVRRAYAEGFVFSGQYTPSRKRRHGTNSSGIDPSRFIVFMQNHDQIGNKLYGTRLAAETTFEASKMCAAAYILSPYIPMLFMGEEMLETSPFMFFVDHSDEDLLEAVRVGRRRDFMQEDDTGEFPDPIEQDTFEQCVLDHSRLSDPKRAMTWKYYKEVLRLRREHPAIANVAREQIQVKLWEAEECLTVMRQTRDGATILILNFSDQDQTLHIPLPTGRPPDPEDLCAKNYDDSPEARFRWKLLLASAAEEWGGPGTIAPATLEREGTAEVQIRFSSALLYGLVNNRSQEPAMVANS